MRTFAVVAVLAALCAPAAAGLIAYEGVNHDPGVLRGNVPDLNLNAWSDQGNDGYQVTSPGLTYGSLQVSGNKAIGGGAWTSAGLTIQMPATWEPDNEWVPYRKLGPGDVRFRAGKEGTTLWASFLVEDWVADDGNRVRFANSHVGWNPGSNGVGVKVDGGNWKLEDVASGAVTDTGVARTINETYLMVLKFEFMIGGDGETATWEEGCDRVTMFVNPTPGAAAPDVAGTVMSTTTDLALLNVHFYPGSGSSEGAIDEIRLGETYADVTPVPEPATLALVALGGLMPLLRRRRR